MRTLGASDLIEDLVADHVDGDHVVVDLGYRGSAHVVTPGTEPLRVLPGHHGFRAPLYVPGDDLVDALRLVEAVGRSRPLRLVMGRFADEYIRDILRHVDGRGQWSVSALLLVDPAARARLPRWVDALDADLPDTWLVGVSTVDERRPVVRVRHGDRIAMLVRDPMIAAVRI